jgi:Zn-dependent metalloprotease
LTKIQPIPKRPEKKIINTINGSFFANLEKEKIAFRDLENQINGLLGLNEDHSFDEVSDHNHLSKANLKESENKCYQHYYKGIKVDESNIIAHEENGFVKTLNGRIVEFDNLNIQHQRISKDRALKIAKRYLKVKELINSYPVETVIARIPKDNSFQIRVVQKVRIDSYDPFEVCFVLIDISTGEVLNKINLVAHADVLGTGQTLYSGNQSITYDSYQGSYRLRESGRSIHTFNATNVTNLDTNGFTGSTDFISSSSSWTGVSSLNTFTIFNVTQSWWYSVFADEIPDLYIVVKDGNNQTIYTSGYHNNTFPSVSWQNLGILMTDTPYTVEVWDYDPVGSDDFGGSYPISSNTVTQNWSGNGNSGSYTIGNSGHPAVDLHWGMETTYDFYLDSLGRNSFDDNGTLIKQYLNSPFTQANLNGDPNNAFAMPAPYNIMVYGMGDGQIMNPVVGLDVEGHEFTHLVINNNGNGGLTYQGESGALNESFADIFGTCVEFYSGVNADWEIGEDVTVSATNLRSMLNPNNANGLSQQPDTYQGTYWANPNNGVHKNSGVQNYWFYLLAQGGSGTNDLGNPYSVTGIGLTDARDIAYRNLTNYLTSSATFMDAYYGSLQAADDLFGNPSTEYTAVQQAWYAVGIGNDPNNYCSGTTNLTSPSGTFTDGSGSADYQNNSNCTWVISPPGATQIALNFNSFDTEANYDSVVVYNGPDTTYPVLATWWGNTLPPTISTSSGTGAMTVQFLSDVSITKGGWSASYTSTGTSPSCGGATLLSDSSGSFSDGSGGSNYGNNQLCYWYISPPCANSVTLSFSQFDTEQGYDGLIIYDDWSGTNQLAVLSGTSLPSSITSNTGKMLVIFTSDYSLNYQGFSANYTSTGSAYCSGTTTLNSTDWGTISDGSGANNYCNNTNCEWLIQPPQATSVTLDFTEFDLEPASSDGQIIYDAVEVYDGTNSNAPLLGTFTGNNLPPSITSSSGSMFVRFYSDIEVNGLGWEAIYTSTQNGYCSDTTTLTAPNGTFSDGSNTDQYANNSACSWLIQPPNSSFISLTFSSFDTEQGYDGVVIYDGIDNAAPILGQFSGSTIPSPVTSTGGSLFVEFLSDPSVRGDGWTANYSSSIVSVVAVTSCGPYTATNGTTYYSNISTPIDTLISSAGQDSIVILNLTINSPTSGSETVAACSSYLWNGTTYTATGTYTTTLTGANGCDSVATLNLTINSPTSGSETVAACSSYLWNGTTYTTTGTYTTTLTGANGCDSVATLNLTINSPTSGSETIAACSSYLWNGTTYTTTGTYTTTLAGANGCDSVATLNLTINSPTSGSETVAACSSYLWNGTTYTTTGTYTTTLTGANGCDSVATLNLTINSPTSGSETVAACSSYLWNGTTYTTSGTYTATLTGANGCDSVATLNLTINSPTSGTDVITACDSFTWIDGNTYTASNSNSTYTLINAAGCDSVVTLNLTIGSIDTTVTLSGLNIYALPGYDSYQWYECTANGFVSMNNETNDSINITANGDYAVVINNSNCTDTSVCVTVNNIGFEENNQVLFKLFPNPTEGMVQVERGNSASPISTYQLQIVDSQGKMIQKSNVNFQDGFIVINLEDYPAGIYQLTLINQYEVFHDQVSIVK